MKPHAQRRFARTTLHLAVLGLMVAPMGAVLGQAATDPSRFEPITAVEVDARLVNLPAPARSEPADSLATIRMELDHTALPADGQTSAMITVRLLDAKGQPIDRDVDVNVEASAGRIRLIGAKEDESGSHRDLDRITPGVTLTVEHGVGHFEVVSPSVPAEARVRIFVGPLEAIGRISFVPEMRDLLATGIVEGVLGHQHSSANGVTNDQFENELSHFQESFSDGKDDFGARAEFFLKGVIKGDYLLTMAYDSDRASQSTLFRDIRPEEFYPVYGDASVKGFDAQSTHKLYVRIDHEHSFMMYGDFITPASPAGPTALGTYSRTLTGIDGHYEASTGVANGFAARTAAQQVVDEQPSRGTSGPYYVSNLNGIRDSEKVELITRDRNQPALILNVQEMVRYVDYTFDPFAGQVLFMQPVPTVDANFNPISVRITYEVDNGGPNHTVFGGSGQYKFNDSVALGGSYAQDTNPINLYRLESIEGTFKLDPQTSLLVEGAHSALNQGLAPVLVAPYSPVEAGSAERISLRHSDGPWEVAVDAGRSDIGFYNPAATLSEGRDEISARATYQVNPDLKLGAEVLDSEDRSSGAKREGEQVFGDYRLSDLFSLELGLRYTHDQLGQIDGQPVAVNAAAAGLTNTPIGQAFTPTQISSPQLQNATGLSDSTSLRLKLTMTLSPKSSLFVEYERDIFDPEKRRYALGGDYQVAEGTRIYGRHEWSSSSSGPYGLDVEGAHDSMTTIGIERDYMVDGQIFSEYRLRDSMDEQDAVASFGVRNLWKLADGVRMTTSFEEQDVLYNSLSAAATRIGAIPQASQPSTMANPLSAAGAGVGSVSSLPGTMPLGTPVPTGTATVVTGALELTYDPLWKAAGRLELRQDPDYNAVLSTLAYSRKLDKDWTFIARNFLDYLDARNATVADESEDRLQIGTAFRPTEQNNWSALARYELRVSENLTPLDPARELANIFTLAGNYHPSRPWWFGARLAAEHVADNFDNVRSDYTAYLVGGRIIYDLNAHWDLGFTDNVLFSPEGNARQYSTGVEIGYLLKKNLWLSLGYNWVGFSNRDLAGSDYTNRGIYVRLRFKFDEDLLGGEDSPIAGVFDAGNSSLPK